LTQTGEHIGIDKVDDTLYVAGHVKTIEGYNAVEQVLGDKGYKHIVNEVYLPLNAINQKVTDQSMELNTLQNSVLTLKEEMNSLSSKYKNTVFQLRQMQVLKNIDIDRYERVHKTFKNIKQYNSQDSSLTFNDNKLFDIGGMVPKEDSLKNLGLVFTRYIEVLMADARMKHYLKEIIIESHTDSTGTFKKNQSLSYQRAQQIRNYLLSLQITKRFKLERILKIKGLGQQHLIYVDGKEDMKASRRINIKFKYYYKNKKTIIK
jgi:outer membrane protein OmpA-like peptidoglycan-associated protein